MFKQSLVILILATVAAAPRPAQAQPRLVVKNVQQNLPPIREGIKLPIFFGLENHGDADLLIYSAKSSCGCTTVSLTEEERRIPPGGKLDLKVLFNSAGRPGVQNKSVAIQTNDLATSRVVLRFRIEVRTLFRTVPGQKLFLGNVRRGEQLAKVLDLLPTAKNLELEIVSVVMPKGVMRYQAKPLEVDGAMGQRLTLTVNEHAPLGPVSGMAQITARVGDEEETRTLKIVGAVLGEVRVYPPRIRVDLPIVRGTALRPVEITAVDGKPFKVYSAEAGPSLSTEIEPNDDGSQYTITMRIADDAVDGPLGAYLRVRTDRPLQPVVRVPVFAFVAPRLRIDPAIVLLGTGVNDEAQHRPVILKNPAKEDFSILEVLADKDYVEVKIVDRPGAPTGFRFLDVALKAGARPDQAVATVTVKTDLPGAETVTIPVLIGRADQEIVLGSVSGQ